MGPERSFCPTLLEPGRDDEELVGFRLVFDELARIGLDELFEVAAEESDAEDELVLLLLLLEVALLLTLLHSLLTLLTLVLELTLLTLVSRCCLLAT